MRISRRGPVRFILTLAYMLPAVFVWLAGYRFIVVAIPSRLGHLAAEIDWFLKKQAMGEFPPVRPVLLLGEDEVANVALLRMWGAYVRVVSNPSLIRLLRPFTLFRSLTIKLKPSFYTSAKTSDYQYVLNRWGDREPIFTLPVEVEREGRAALRAMGMPDDAWFVCVHARDGIFSPTDENIHSYRNCNIENYSLAVDEIVSRGGWCVRMGERGTPPLAERPGLVNYPDTGFKTDWMDIFLCAKARFFLGNTSGLCMVSTISGVRCALANMIQHGASYAVSPYDISIPKLLRRKDGSYLTFPEIFLTGIGNFRGGDEYAALGIAIVENTPEDIRDIAVEMLDMIEGKFQRTAEDEARQEAFRGLLQPHHYMYGARSHIGSAFLKKHERLLEEGARPLEAIEV